MDNRNSDNTQRQSSRSASNADAIDCIVNTSDLVVEDDLINKEQDRKRGSSNSRRDLAVKRSIETSTYRTQRNSPISNSRKRHSSPRSGSSTSRSHHHQHHHHHHQSQRYRVSSPSPSPPPLPSSSSRHHRSAASVKRPHSPSRSPYERRTQATRSRREPSKERTTNDMIQLVSPDDEKTKLKSKSSNQETTDLSFVSEDESTKPYDNNKNNMVMTESLPVTPSTKLHSTPSVPILQPTSNESLLEMSNIPAECEISLFAKSSLSTPTANPILPTPTLPTNDFLQTIDLISRYKAMQAMPCNDPLIEACSKEVLILIKKQIELQKIELDYREREIKLRERELVEREKRFNERTNDTTDTTPINCEPLIQVKPTIVEEKTQTKSEMTHDQDRKEVSEEPAATSVPMTDGSSKTTVTNKNDSEQPSVIRKKIGKSRFSPTDVVLPMADSQENPIIDIYSDDSDTKQSSLSLKKPIISKISAPSDPTISMIDTELKVTSSNSCRKVEFQSGNIDKPMTSKESSHDLRFTLSKNRTKHQKNPENNGTIDDQIKSDEESAASSNKSISSKIQTTKDDKQQSLDYHQQRSVTSTSMEIIIDDANDKRDNRRRPQQRFHGNRQQQYPIQSPSASGTNTKERSYSYGSPTQSSSKYGSNQKRYETSDLRSRLFENKNSKSSRTAHRNNY